MKHVLILVFVSTAFVGCNNSTPVQNNNIQAVSPQKTEHHKRSQNRKAESTAIVMFKKGTTIQTAKEIINDYGMHVLKVYKSISINTHKPMLHVGSSLPTQKMIQLLRKDPRISSVSPDYVRHLDNR